MKEDELINKLSVDLGNKFRAAGTQYEVLQPNAEFFVSNAMRVTPDLVVHNTSTDSYLIVELQHYDHKRPLSLSTIPLVHQLKADNQHRNVQVAVVTNSSSISDSLRNGLQIEHVPVIEYTDNLQISERVWEFIKST